MPARDLAHGLPGDLAIGLELPEDAPSVADHHLVKAYLLGLAARGLHSVEEAELQSVLRLLELCLGDGVVLRGLEPGEVVVTAGVQALRPGQKVRLLGATP